MNFLWNGQFSVVLQPSGNKLPDSAGPTVRRAAPPSRWLLGRSTIADVTPRPFRQSTAGVRTGVHELMLNRLGLENRLSGDDVKKSRWSRIGVDEISSELNILSVRNKKKFRPPRGVSKKCSDRLLFKFERSQMQLKLWFVLRCRCYEQLLLLKITQDLWF